MKGHVGLQREMCLLKLVVCPNSQSYRVVVQHVLQASMFTSSTRVQYRRLLMSFLILLRKAERVLMGTLDE